MITPKKLQKPVYEKVLELMEKGNALLDNDEDERALETFERALAWIPAPQEEYEIAHELIAAMGDVHWFAEDFDEALASFEEAQAIFGGIHGHYQPFLLLRIGQCFYCIAERDDDAEARTKAHELLSKALEVLGEEIFEDEDEVFLEFARSAISA